MKISKILYKIIILTTLIAMIIPCNMSFAKSGFINQGIVLTGINIGTSSSELPDLDKYQPQPDFGVNAKRIISTILGVLTVIGIIVIVLSIAIIGFNTILGSASEKAEGKEKYVGIFIAALFITFGSIIARIIISVAENI